MFKRREQSVKNLILYNLRAQGLETPLLQKRLIEAWPIVAGEAVARYTTDVRIFNQTLFVRLRIPALRADLSMRRQEFVNRLNEYVGNQVITDIRKLLQQHTTDEQPYSRSTLPLSSFSQHLSNRVI